MVVTQLKIFFIFSHFYWIFKFIKILKDNLAHYPLQPYIILMLSRILLIVC